MSFRRQLISGQIAAVIVTVLTGTVAIVTLQAVTSSTGDVARQIQENVGVVQAAHLGSEQLVAAGRGYLLTGNERYRQKLLQIEARFDLDLGELRERTRGSQRDEKVTAIGRHADAYVAAVRRAAYERPATGGAGAMFELFEEEVAPRREIFASAVDEFVRDEQRIQDAAFVEANAAAARATLVLVATSAVGIALVMVFGGVVMRRLTREYRRVEEANALATRASDARKELLAIVSHDLRSPLSTIMLSATMLEGGSSENRRMIAATISAAERMQHLIDELVDVARIETGAVKLAPETLDVRPLLELTTTMFQLQAEQRGVQLRVACSVDRMTADRERILQVLSNLVGNALKFARRGTAITISAKEVAASVHFEVTDSGPGIVAEEAEHLFDRGWQGTHGKHGLGLGLYICKGLIEAHRGRIGVESAAGTGSTFWFDLPRDPEPAC